MINFIRGKIILIKEDFIVLENNGIGYEIFLTTKDIKKISDKIDKDFTIYTYLVHKEDSLALFGFIKEETKNFFNNLLKIDGIGPKLALKILGNCEVEEIYRYIQEENFDMLKRIPGIGQKMVGKLILELKGKISLDTDRNINNFEKELISAFVNLGYEESLVINTIKKTKIESDDFEKEFKKILKILSGK